MAWRSPCSVGGNFGSSLGPLLAAVIIAPYGKGNVAWFVLAALLAIIVLAQISRWYAAQHRVNKGKPKAKVINPCRAIRLSSRLPSCWC